MFPHTVQNARPQPIDDRLLAQLRRIAHDARVGQATEAEVEWLLSVTGALMDELAKRRAFMATLPEIVDLTNVITLSAVR
jgi:hypothetical protein